MNGISTTRDSMITRIFGTKVSVISWICVSACRMEMMRPQASAISMTGAPILSATMIASLPITKTSLTLMVRRSHRHLDDVLIGGDHLVAHGDHGLQGGLGIGESRR